MEQVLNLTCWRVTTVDQIFGFASQQNLTSYGNFGALFVSNGGIGFVVVIKDNGYAGLCDSSLTLFVHKLRKITSSNLAQIRNSQDETDRI